jgi:prefoldin subunit 5
MEEIEYLLKEMEARIEALDSQFVSIKNSLARLSGIEEKLEDIEYERSRLSELTCDIRSAVINLENASRG